MTVAAYSRTQPPVVALEFVQDVVSGLNVRESHYVDLTAIDPLEDEYGHDIVPFAVLMWDDGLDYDEEGNSYFDSPPEWYVHSFHKTQVEAEIEMAWMEWWDFNPNKMMLEENHLVEPWEMDRFKQFKGELSEQQSSSRM
jgi:hypothetical protein